MTTPPEPEATAAPASPPTSAETPVVSPKASVPLWIAIVTTIGGIVVAIITTLGAQIKSDPRPITESSSAEIHMDESNSTRSIEFLDNYSGSIKGSGRGEAVWLFNQQLTRDSDPQYTPGDIYALIGPCPIQDSRWTCRGVGVGGPTNPAETDGTYRVWAAVVDERTQFDIVNELRNRAGMIPNRVIPTNSAVDSIVVRRR